MCLFVCVCFCRERVSRRELEKKKKGKVLSKEPISSLSNALWEAKSVFSVFFSGFFLSAVFYAAPDPQLSFLFLTKTHHLVRQ